ncbi:MAG: DUF2182 domain-containing protein, partial [Gemmatimonadota bacterium]|nr:DUF2182 domain-containing protein [Gemmatimonadota bacterium]
NRNLIYILILIGSLLVLSWTYTIHMAASMDRAPKVSQLLSHNWLFYDYLMAASMWAIMMIGMMLPGVTPWILTLSGIRKNLTWDTIKSAVMFLTGYILAWTLFSVIAAIIQGALHDRVLLDRSFAISDDLITGGLLVTAGVYQWTPIKESCLKHCRTPLGFFVTSWKDGDLGAVYMGFTHGLFCVGCCWALMSLSFVAGIMNLLWMAGVTVYILIDHTVTGGSWLGRLLGFSLVGWGLWYMLKDV